MAALPELLDRNEHLDLGRRSLEPRLRVLGLLVIAGIVATGLANVFGQKASDESTEADAATLTVRAPENARSGLIYQARFRVDARRNLAEPSLVFDPGWFDGFTINTFQPEPVEIAHRNGRTIFRYDPVPAGGFLVLRLQYQVNPTTFGRRAQNVALLDGDRPILTLRRTLTVYP